MPDQWYYKSERNIHGPCTAAEILRLAADAVVLPQDPVRQGDSGPWVKFAFCEEALKSAAQFPAPTKPATRSGTTPPNAKTSSNNNADANAESGESNRASSRDRHDRARRAGFPKWPRRRSTLFDHVREFWGLAVALLLLLAVNYFVFALSQEAPTAQRLRLLKDVFAQAKRLESAKASVEEWNELAKSAHESIDPIVADLKKNADVHEAIDQHILWMARDYLLPMIDDHAVMAQNPSKVNRSLQDRIEKASQEFENHAESIKWILEKRAKRAQRK